MLAPASLCVFLASAILPVTLAATRVIELGIANEDVSPDNFTRSYVVETLFPFTATELLLGRLW
jgi:hypothetical protein